MSLRSKIIRLAHSQPALRADLLPLLSRTAAVSKKWDTAHFFKPDQAKTFGDRRMTYVPFHELDSKGQADAKRAFGLTKSQAKYDFIHEHYYYPVDKSGNLGKGRRVLAIPLKQIEDDKYMASLGYEITPFWAEKHPS